MQTYSAIRGQTAIYTLFTVKIYTLDSNRSIKPHALRSSWILDKTFASKWQHPWLSP